MAGSNLAMKLLSCASGDGGMGDIVCAGCSEEKKGKRVFLQRSRGRDTRSISKIGGLRGTAMHLPDPVLDALGTQSARRISIKQRLGTERGAVHVNGDSRVIGDLVGERLPSCAPTSYRD